MVPERTEVSEGDEEKTKKPKKQAMPAARTTINQPSLANSTVLHVESFQDFRIGMQIKITRQEISRFFGCSREMVGRVLIDLEEKGLGNVKGKTMVVFGTR